MIPVIHSDDNTTIDDGIPDPRPDVRRLVQAHGVSANAFQVLEPGYEYFFHGSSDHSRTVIAYVATQRWLVVASGPIGPQAMAGEAFQAFVAFGKASGRAVIMMGIEPSSLSALESVLSDYSIIKIGEQPEWDPRRYSTQGPMRKTVRAQVNRAQNKGVRIRRVDASELARAPGVLRLQVQYIMEQWLASRKVAPLRFMVNLEPFLYPQDRRYYVAERGDETVGFLAAIPVYGRKGWFFEDVIRVPDAPNGTGEALIHEAMKDAREQDAEYATLGLSPLVGIAGGPGEDRFLRWGLRQMSKRFGTLYGFDGLRRFKSRFKPDQWVPQYAILHQEDSRFSAVWALLCAFAPESVPRFLYESFRRLMTRVSGRAWSLLMGIQLAILIPWTALLAVADGSAWFGDESIKWAWVVFNSILGICLLGLTRMLWIHHPSARRISMFLAGATMTDAVVSTTQAVQLHSEMTGWAAVFVLLGVIGPYVATVFLWCIAIAAPLKPSHRSILP